MYSSSVPVEKQIDVWNERLKRARERGDHAAVLILEGEIRKLTKIIYPNEAAGIAASLEHLRLHP